VAWLAFLTSAALGVPFTFSQDAKRPGSVSQSVKKWALEAGNLI